MIRSVELRSDTFTRPTPDMRQAMYEAEVGDDVWHEDPTVHRLEARGAELTGKEAAVLVSSGTQGNLIGLLSHTQRGNEVILGDQSHIFRYEAAGTAVCGGLQLHTLPNGKNGRLDPEMVHRAIRPNDEHEPRTGCIALENTHNRCGGAVLGVDEVAAVGAVAHSVGIPFHLDGARVFNAVAALGVPVSDLLAQVDSVTFCLSKGLGAPVGSLLCGSADFIAQARRWRKMLGGGMRQAGVLAAAGLVALDYHRDRLVDDHANARILAEGLATIPGVTVINPTPDSNMVFFDITATGRPLQELAAQLAQQGVRVAGGGPGTFRAVTSLEVSRADIEYALHAIAEVVRATAPAFA